MMRPQTADQLLNTIAREPTAVAELLTVTREIAAIQEAKRMLVEMGPDAICGAFEKRRGVAEGTAS